MSVSSFESPPNGSEHRLVLTNHFERNPPSSKLAATGENMLTVDFSTPLSGQARIGKVQQMAKNHPAIEKSRGLQEILVRIQHSLRRMPGVSAAEANELVRQLVDVGQIVNQEISQLVDALINMQLDQEDTDRAIARISIHANLTKATADDQAQTIQDLEKELTREKVNHMHEETQVEKLSTELNALKERSLLEQCEPDARDELIKSLEDTIKKLEDKSNERCSLWPAKNSDSDSAAPAIDTPATSVKGNEVAHSSIMALKPAAPINDVEDTLNSNETEYPLDVPHSYSDYLSLSRSSSAFQQQPHSRPPPVGPLKYGHSHYGLPSRNSSTFSHNDRRYQNSWNSGSSGHGRSGIGGSGSSFWSTSSFGRGGQSKRGFHGPPPRFRNGGADFHHQPGYSGCGSGGGFNDTMSNGPSNSYDNGGYGYGRDYYPQTPTSRGRNRYNHMHDNGYSSVDQNHRSSATVGRANSAVTPPGPLIHLTERSVSAWHEQIMDFYGVIRSFVEQYANLPDNANSIRTGSNTLWPILIATYHPLSEREATSYLDLHLKSENSKSCLVTRVIIDYIVNRVWVPGAWINADSESTFALLEVERELDRTQGHSSAIRQPLIDQQAAIIDTIMKNEDDTSFYKGKLEEITGTLLTNLQPLLNKFVNPSDAYRDLGRVTENAWELSSKILTSRLAFDFRFPEIGSRFSSQSMLPIWPHMDPLELQAKHWRVAMVTTPVITCRNDTGSNISAHSVAMADVFCMQ